MPALDTLKACWQGNENGAGIGFVRAGDSEVTLSKGFMRFRTLKRVLGALKLGLDDMAVIHFRFATHGLIDGGNCHPFPLSNTATDLRARQGKFPMVVAHNGVFGSMADHDTLSDTQKFVGGILSNPAIKDNVENKAVKELLRGYCGSSSKLVFLSPRNLTLIGDWVTDIESGLLFSNHGYISYSKASKVESKEDHSNDDYTYNKCELCTMQRETWFDSYSQLFLCAKCLEFNHQACC